MGTFNWKSPTEVRRKANEYPGKTQDTEGRAGSSHKTRIPWAGRNEFYILFDFKNVNSKIHKRRNFLTSEGVSIGSVEQSS